MDTNTDYAALYYTDISKETDVLETNVKDYPASSVARFMLLYHLKKKNDPRFDEVAKQTGVYLHNPYWMEYQLSKFQQSAMDGEENISIKKTADNFPIENEDSIAESILVNREEEHDQAVIDTQEEIEAPIIEDEKTSPTVNEQIGENFPSTTETGETAKEDFVSESQAEVINENQNDLIEQSQEELPAVVNEQINENLPQETEPVGEENKELAEGRNEEAVLSNEIVEVPGVEEPKEEIVAEENIPEPQPDQEQNQNIEENLNQQEEVFVENVSADEENPDEEETEIAVPFEPLHTVDYFASQGIQLSEEALNNDQLGKQVKSFTAWLKSMKKLHPGQLPEQNEVIEKLIQTSSEASNQNANVLTEAMAEVLVKQGKREKAMEMYQKLSLINPSKSAYFAAKIENLKII